jgi:hypothetical protein
MIVAAAASALTLQAAVYKRGSWTVVAALAVLAAGLSASFSVCGTASVLARY